MDTDGDGYPDTDLGMTNQKYSTGRGCYSSQEPPPNSIIPLGAVRDNCPYQSNPEQTDKDRDGVDDACDSDMTVNPWGYAYGLLLRMERVTKVISSLRRDGTLRLQLRTFRFASISAAQLSIPDSNSALLSGSTKRKVRALLKRGRDRTVAQQLSNALARDLSADILKFSQAAMKSPNNHGLLINSYYLPQQCL